MNNLSIFYTIYVPPGRSRTILDAVRLFARPQTKHPAHITVRGPYTDYQDPRAWSAEVKGKQVEVRGVGTFFERDQNTVFLHVHSPAIRAVWHKPDYPQGKPHLTLYDGESRPFAETLRDILVSRETRFTFLATGLEPMIHGSPTSLLRAMYDPSELIGFLESPPSLAEVDAADPDTRLAWIAKLAEYFATEVCNV